MKMLTIEEIKGKVRSEVGEGRFLHSVAVAEMAKKLAEAHGFSERDVARAEVAGLVHDIAKEFSGERNRKYVEAGRLDESLLGEAAKNFVHAEVGAEVAREMGLDEEQVAAVRHHTIPVRGMSELEKIVFLADKVGRKDLPEELGEVLEMATRDLDGAMLKFLLAQEKELAGRGISHSEETKKLIQELKKKMLKVKKLERGDTVGVVSLSSGVLGERFVQHEVEIFERRLREEFGLKIKYMDNARRGINYLREHPEARAEDLKQAFLDKEVKIIWSAIGGDDSVRLAPFIMTEEFKKIVQENPKMFMGFSDTTSVHLMLYKLGLKTFYGPALLPDVAELGPEMLLYTKEWVLRLFEDKFFEQRVLVETSPVWYRARSEFGPEQVGVRAEEVKEERGVIWTGEQKTVEGELVGGCLDVLAKMIEKEGVDTKFVRVFPEREEWRGKVLFIEPSDMQVRPEEYKKMIQSLERRGVFDGVVGVLAGKPMDEKYFEEYLEILNKVGARFRIPVVYNLNFGHATPRMILEYGRRVRIEMEEKKVWLLEDGEGLVRR